MLGETSASRFANGQDGIAFMAIALRPLKGQEITPGIIELKG
jgi:hypothetical protein